MATRHPMKKSRRCGSLHYMIFAAIMMMDFTKQSERLLDTTDVRSNNLAKTTVPQDALRIPTKPAVLPSTRAQDLSEKPQSPIRNLPWPGNLDHLADKNNVIVVVTVTCPYIHMLDNLVESMRRANVTNVAMVPLDEGAPRVLRAMYGNDGEYKFGQVLDPPPFVEAKASFSVKPAKYNGLAFRTIVSWRPQVMRAFLEQNYTVFYTDTDTYWRSNPLEFLHKSSIERHAEVAQGGQALETFNFNVPESLRDTISSDALDMVAMFDSGTANVCTGYLYMQPTIQSKVAMEQWAKNILDAKISLNQPAFKIVYKTASRRSQIVQVRFADKSRRFPNKAAKNLRLNKNRNLRSRVYRDDNKYFPSGSSYVNNLSQEEKENVLMIHGNFIVGMDQKADALKRWGVWKPSGRLPQFISRCTAGKR